MLKIILIRHCKTISNESGKLQGYHDDSGFTEEGIKQMKALSKKLKSEKIDAVYCSDLGRAYKTAQAIAKEHKLGVNKVKNLREADIGEWSNLPVKKAIGKWMRYYKEEKAKGIPREEIRPPAGENAWDHQKRLLGVITQIYSTHKNGTIVIVGHAGTNKVLLGSFQNTDPDDFYKVPQDNACINIINFYGNSYKVISINDTTHLKDEKN